MRLKNKVAIVTGGASGIGEATALHFAEEGAKVVVADLDAERGKTIEAQIREKAGDAVFVHADISEESDANKITGEAVMAYGRVDILVNNAAAFVLKGLEATIDDWQRSLGTNVIGTALVSRFASEQMKKNGGGGDREHQFPICIFCSAEFHYLQLHKGRDHAYDAPYGSGPGSGEYSS